MFKRTVSAEELIRLRVECEAADRAYQEALSAIDRAVVRQGGMPELPPEYDEHQITPLNEAWDLLDGGALPRPTTGWRSRVRAFIWDLLEPVVARQRTFNALLVNHINRNVAAHRGAHESIVNTITVLNEKINEIYAFRGWVMNYLQLVTAYVETKDREIERTMRRINEDCRELIDILDHRTVALSAGMGGVADELQKRWESMVARERRYDARVTAIASEQDRTGAEVQTSLGVLQRATQGLKREIERLAEVRPVAGVAPTAEDVPSGRVRLQGGPFSETTPAAAASAGQLAGSALDSHKYVGFEDEFRGSEADIRARVAEYLPYFEGTSDVLDVGCGRGEFLSLLREHGITARGLDINHEMVEVCRAAGLDVAQGDALGYLRSLPDASLGGLFSAQVVEHLEPEYLLQLLDVASQKLRAGARIVLETINPACWAAFFESYIRDITHVRPLHPDTLKYLLIASGFSRVEIRFRAPYPAEAKLQTVPLPPGTAEREPLGELAETINENVHKLNDLLFTYLDYAAIGQKN